MLCTSSSEIALPNLQINDKVLPKIAIFFERVINNSSKMTKKFCVLFKGNLMQERMLNAHLPLTNTYIVLKVGIPKSLATYEICLLKLILL